MESFAKGRDDRRVYCIRVHVTLCPPPPPQPHIYFYHYQGSKGFGMNIDLFVVSPLGISPRKFGQGCKAYFMKTLPI